MFGRSRWCRILSINKAGFGLGLLGAGEEPMDSPEVELGLPGSQQLHLLELGVIQKVLVRVFNVESLG